MAIIIFSSGKDVVFKDTSLDRKRALINIVLSLVIFSILFLWTMKSAHFSFYLVVPLSVFILCIQILNFTLFRRKSVSVHKGPRRHNRLAIHRVAGHTNPIYIAEWVLMILSWISVMYLGLANLGFGMEYWGMYVVAAIIGVLLFIPVLDVIFANTGKNQK